MIPEITPGKLKGRITLRNLCIALAPRSELASSKDSSSFESIEYIGKMFAGGIQDSARVTMMSLLTPSFITVLAVGIVAACPIIPFIKKKTQEKKIYKGLCVAGYAMTLVLYLLCVMSLASDSYNPFIYFRF